MCVYILVYIAPYDVFETSVTLQGVFQQCC